MDDGRSMRAVKDSPVARVFRNHLRTSGREARKKIKYLATRTSPHGRSIRGCMDKTQRG